MQMGEIWAPLAGLKCVELKASHRGRTCVGPTPMSFDEYFWVRENIF
jgi:hypothetical protein